MRYIILLLLIATKGFGAVTTWYFDSPALTTSLNLGTSWANAWTNVASVNWTLVNAGDTLLISGGTTSKTYHEPFLFDQEGTLSQRFWVRVGQEAGHNGVADFGTNGQPRPVNAAYKYWTVDGHRGLNYTHPTNWYQVRQGDWTNNIGFWTHDRVGTTSDPPDPLNLNMTEGADYITNRYIYVSGYTNSTTGFGSGLDERGIIFRHVMENIAVTNLVYQNILLIGNSGTQVSCTDQTNNFYGGFLFEKSMILNCGEDHFETGNGWTIRDNVIGPYVPDDVHCDIFQLTGSYFEVYNNFIRESGHSYFRFQSQSRGGKNPATPEHNGHIKVYNNIQSEILGRAFKGGAWNEGIVFVHFNSAPEEGGHIIWTNILFANNTWYNSILSSNETATGAMMGNPWILWTKGQYVTNAYLKNIRFINNVTSYKHKGNVFPSTTNIGGVTGAGTWVNYEPFTTNDFVVNNNIFAGNATALITDPRIVGYLDVSDELETHTYKFLNTTNIPLFINEAGENFDLQATDIAALNTGSNLNSDFTYDSLYRPRGELWSRGAMESDAGLVLYFSFDNDSLGGNATDDSGNGYTGYRGNMSEFGYPSNKLASGQAGTVFRTNVTGRASDHLWRTNNTLGHFDDGSFFYVTNAFNALSNMSQMTVMVWARYNTAARTDRIGADSSDDNYATLIAGNVSLGTKGSWALGRYAQQININETRFYIHTNDGAFTPSWGSYGDPVFGNAGRVVWQYSDYGFNNNGDTTNYYHYAFTFNSGIGINYFNGVPLGTNDISANVTTLRLGDHSGISYDWLCVGCSPHSGTPQFGDDAYPNHGWMNGMIDNPRIYNRVLPQQEIADIIRAEGGSATNAPAESPGSTITGTLGKPIGRIKLSR